MNLSHRRQCLPKRPVSVEYGMVRFHTLCVVRAAVQKTSLIYDHLTRFVSVLSPDGYYLCLLRRGGHTERGLIFTMRHFTSCLVLSSLIVLLFFFWVPVDSESDNTAAALIMLQIERAWSCQHLLSPLGTLVYRWTQVDNSGFFLVVEMLQESKAGTS